MMLVDKKTGAKYRVPEVDYGALNYTLERAGRASAKYGIMSYDAGVECYVLKHLMEEVEEFHDALKNGKSLERWRIG